jgi:hypothetical protein
MRRPRAACPNHGTAGTAVSPPVPTGSHRPRLRAAHVRRPRSTASIGYKGSPTPREQPFFLLLIAPTASPCSAAIEPPCSVAPGPPPSSPSPPRALRHRVPPSHTVSHRPSPQTVPPPPFPSGRPHITTELILPVRTPLFQPPVGCAVLPSHPSALALPPPLHRLVPLPMIHRVAPPPTPSEVPVAAMSTMPPCTTFLHREPSTIAPGRRPHHRSPPADRTLPQSSSFQ